MNDSEIIADISEKQQRFFRTGKTKKIEFRKEQLNRLKEVLQENEEDLLNALQQDFGKPPFETYGTELGQLYNEINLCISKISKWSKPQRVSGALVNFPSRNYIYSEPYGMCLVIGAWNYPVLLALQPAISAIAAGNTVVVKPSELVAKTSHLLAQIINEAFNPEFFTVIEGDAETAQALLEQSFDYIFFTGSSRVGKMVMQAAAHNLTPVTLELGGKSPAIVDHSADLDVAAKRIVWGKFMNAGQTCVAPDYVYVQTDIKARFIKLLKQYIHELYGEEPAQSPDYPRIINDRHMQRLSGYLTDGKIAFGGQTNTEERYIAPTILDEITWNDSIMQEEIFGPILPVLSFSEYEDVIGEINNRPTPLALYHFCSDKTTQQKVIHQIEFGGGCINDTLAHLGNPNLPFGGKGNSGIGNYHGKAGFDTFSHQKSIMEKPTWIDIPLRYAPYKNKIKWLKKIFW